ncbi:hypothetical protein ACFO6V_26270 [Promicromonospora alba]|uniref:Uncharacterized protein n=1 Tax=Promicromonospora alba TaxID=1616110 RepID=A0ABV9HR84_9MICO
MSRIEGLDRRYAASATIVHSGVEIFAVGDPEGARFNAAVRHLLNALRDDGQGLWDDLAGVSKALRWRLITEPQPMDFNSGMVELADEVGRHARRLRGAVADQSLLEDLAESAAALVGSERESALGAALLQACLEAGPRESVVIAASRRAQLALESWLQKYGILVLAAGDLERDQPDRGQAYVVGPPRFYRSSLVTAPVTDEVSFLLPAWFGDRSVPRSAIARYAEGSIRVEARIFTLGDTSEPEQNVPVEADDEDAYLPRPVWGKRESDDREPTSEEVSARKILLSGNLAMWLDDGERIRSLDPQQPPGERVAYTEVAAVREGTYFLLRQGVTERGALYQAALAKLGLRGQVVDATQAAWKQRLGRRLQQHGYRQVARDLRAVGVKTVDRARAWTDPSLIRPISDQDFESLLQWLGIPIQPTFGHATLLRKMLYQASAEIGKQLEAAASAADLTELKASGHLSLEGTSDGFRGILATRVLAISPYSEIVPRHDARVPFEDRSGQWLE